jgi:Carboxypeptidase regulatory-like domain
LTGRVTDKTGGAISGAQVFLIRDGVEMRQITTDQSGQFQFGDIEAGVYDIKIVIQGFAQEVIRGVAAGAGNSASLNLTMDPSGLVGPSPPQFTVDKPVWNGWAEEFGEKARFKPLPVLKTNSSST